LDEEHASTKCSLPTEMLLPNRDRLVGPSIFYFYIYTLNGEKEGAEGE